MGSVLKVRYFGHCVTFILFLVLVSTVVGEEERRKKPIVLEKSGGFSIGGKIISDPKNPNLTLSCDHGYVE